ncbi:MAG: hypothetical protein JJE47_11670 [Acidimicrobiia bacterium]|nr:hypothetical protein [Acidimicrobiia bacterium]
MHNHDLDLVAAHAEGSASPADATLVGEWISTCAECAHEFESQQLAIDSLRLVEPAALSDIERARLRRGVRVAIAEVQLDDSHRARPAPAGGRWLKLLAGSAAAILVLVVAFGVVLPSFGGRDTTSADLAFETTQTSVAAATVAPSATLGTNDDTMMAEAAADAAGLDLMAAAPPVLQLGELTFEDLAALSTPIEDFGPAGATPLHQNESTREAPLPADREAYRKAVEQPLTCAEEGLSLIDGGPIWFGIATIDSRLIELFRSETGLIALEASTCVLVFPTD